MSKQVGARIASSHTNADFLVQEQRIQRLTEQLEGIKTSSDVVTDGMFNPIDRGDDVNGMLSRWLKEHLKDGPYMACCGELYHLCNPGSQAVEGK